MVSGLLICFIGRSRGGKEGQSRCCQRGEKGQETRTCCPREWCCLMTDLLSLLYECVTYIYHVTNISLLCVAILVTLSRSFSVAAVTCFHMYPIRRKLTIIFLL